MSALIFLYRNVLNQELDDSINAIRAKRSRYLPIVLTPDEVMAVINNLSGVYRLVIQILYGSGLRLTEGLHLRVKDLDFAQQQIIVRDAKGQESRVTMLPHRLILPLQEHLQRGRRLHQQDLDADMVLCICPMSWSGNILTPIAVGFGNLFFRPIVTLVILAVEWYVVITCTSLGYNGH